MSISKPLYAGVLLLIVLVFAATTVMAQARKATTVTVVNNNPSAVEELVIVNPGAGGEVIGKLASPLATGKRATVALKGAKSCTVMVSGRYADGGTVEAESMDVCKDKTIRLVD